MTLRAQDAQRLRPSQRAMVAAKLTMTRDRADSVIARMKTASVFMWLPLQGMKIDPMVQRLLRPTWVKKHVPNFNADQIGTLVVSLRRDGSTYVLDGQHRVELLRAVEWGDQLAYCEVFKDITLEEEAAIFLARNDRLSVRSFDKFKSRRTQGDPVALDIVRIVSAAGLAIAEGGNEGHISAVNALERVYRGGGIADTKDGANALRQVLQLIVAAWGSESANFHGLVIEGLGLVLLRYGRKIDTDALIAKLSKVGGSAAGLIGQAKGLYQIHGGSLAFHVGGIVVIRYNRGRRSGKLEKWGL